MRLSWIHARRLLAGTMLLWGLFGNAAPAHATHFRYGHITWRATGGNSVQFTLTAAFARSQYPGSAPDGFLAVGDIFTEFIGGTVLDAGDGTFLGDPFTGMRFIVVALDRTDDYVIARALDPVSQKDRIDHTYPFPTNFGTPWVAQIYSCCRILNLQNNAGGDYRVYTKVDLTVNRASAVSALPPLIPVSQRGTSFLIPATDPEGHRLIFRLADPDEAGFFFVQPPGVTVDPNTGLFTIAAGLPPGLYSTHVIIEEYDLADTLIGCVGLDFIFEVLTNVTTQPPRFRIPPTPAQGTTLVASPGQRISFTISAIDPDGDNVTLNTTGIPMGARHIPVLPVTARVPFCNFSWTPTIDDLGAYAITYTARDPNGNFVLTSVEIRVLLPIRVIEPGGGQAYFPGETVDIVWNSPGFPRAQGLRIELSRDGGLTFPEILADGIPDTSRFTWIVTGPVSWRCRVRISNVSDPADSGVSAGDFAIITGRELTGCRRLTPPADDNRIPDFDAAWKEIPLNFADNVLIRDLAVFVDITHPFIGDLQVQLVHPDGTTVLLHRQTGEGSQDLVRTYGSRANLTVPEESLLVLYGKPTAGTWKLLVRDLIAGDVGYFNEWCLTVRGIEPGRLTVRFPNGGETLAVGTRYDVTWDRSRVDRNVRILLSRDGGATFAPVGVAPVADGAFNFLMTGPTSGNALVRVESDDEPFIQDVSDSGFAITVPNLRLVSPNGGERVSTGRPTTIRWVDAPPAASVRIELSKDSGITWSTIIAAAPDTGEYVWVPTPADDSTAARIRVTANSGTFRSGQSDADFTVQTPLMTVNRPNGGERWHALGMQEIRWVSVGNPSGVRIDLSRDGGANWETLFADTPDDGSQFWLVSGPPTTQALIRVSSVADDLLIDQSDSAFEIAIPQIRVTFPNGGDSWGIGSTQTITWNSDGVTGNVDVALSRDGGANYSLIATNVPNSGRLDHVVTGPASGQAIVRIQSRDLPVNDTSDSVFRIAAATVAVLLPNGGEELHIGQEFVLRWDPGGAGGDVRIELSRNAGLSYESIATSTANDGEFAWTPTGPDTGQALLRVSSVANPTLGDTSNAPFSIVTPSITVLQPDGGETWVVGSVRTVQWNSQALAGRVMVEVTRNGGTSWEVIIPDTENDGFSDWTVTGPASTNCRVRVSSLLTPAITDQSTGPFSIIQQSLRVLAPNGGQEWLTGSRQTISWVSAGIDPADQVVIDLSRDAGTSWVRLMLTQNSGAAAWDVTGPPTGTARIRVSLLSAPQVTDASDRDFSISDPTIRLVNPRPGDRWRGGTIQGVTWEGSSIRAGGRVDILLSRNGGRTWQVIIEDTANDGAATWLVPRTAVKKALLRIVWRQRPEVNDTMAGPFTILKR